MTAYANIGLSDQAASAPAAREAWIDQTRGLGIVLVVFGHLWRGLYDAGLLPQGRAFEVVDRLIYSFHMPLFFVLAGLFFERALLRMPAQAFVRSRVIRLLYPFLLWTYLFAAFKVCAGSLANESFRWEDMLFSPLPPRWHFWFLWALFVIEIAALGLKALLATPQARTGVWLGTLGLLVALYFAPIGAAAWVPLLIGALHYAPYLALGVLISRLGLPFRGPAAIPAAVVMFVAMEWLALAEPQSSAVTLLVGSVASISVCILASEVSRTFGSTAILSAFGYLGRISMAIYLSHTIFSAAARIALQQAGVMDLSVHMLAGLAFGLLGPVLLFLAAQRTGTVRLLGF